MERPEEFYVPAFWPWACCGVLAETLTFRGTNLFTKVRVIQLEEAKEDKIHQKPCHRREKCERPVDSWDGGEFPQPQKSFVPSTAVPQSIPALFRPSLATTIPAMGPAPLAFDFGFPIMSEPFDQERLFSFYIGLSR